MLRNTILPTVKRVFLPSFGTMMLLVAWGCWWSFLMIGGAIIMAVDNPTRESDGDAVGQPKLGYVDGKIFSPQNRLFAYLLSLFILQLCIFWRSQHLLVVRKSSRSAPPPFFFARLLVLRIDEFSVVEQGWGT